MVTGLPRSRTAWWSVAATTAHSTCLHEPLKNCADFAALKACWHGSAAFVGVSDSGVVSVLDRILEEVQPQTLIVRRAPDAVLKSLAAYLKVETVPAELVTYLREMDLALDSFAEHPLVEVVDFAALNDIDVVEDCYRWLMPGNPAPFNRDLMHMNIQADLGQLQRDVAKPNAFQFLKDHDTWRQ